jgi:predicted Zn-dependent protease
MHYPQLFTQKIPATLLFSAFLALLTLPVFVSAAELPDLGAPDLVEYDQQTEEKLGRAFTTSLHTNYTLNYDPEVVSYIRKIGHKIASHTGDKRHFRFYVIDNDSINAFAGPNGVIGIHTGLIQAVQSEDELASVIAHEIAHITQRHLSRRYEYQSTEGNVASIATLLAAILIGIYDPNAGMATLMGGMGYNIEQQLKNSRAHETEADSQGIELLYKANYNPYAMGDFFARLSKANRNNNASLPEILRTHPVTSQRLAEADNRAQTMPPLKTKSSDDSLNLIKLRLNRSNRKTNSADLLFLKNRQSPAEVCYQLNLLSLHEQNENADLKSTRQCLWQYMMNDPEQTLYSNLMIESVIKNIPNDNNSLTRILNYAEYQQALNPTDISVLLRYAELLIKLDKIDDAIHLLESKSNVQNYQYQVNKKLAEISAQQNKNAEAYYYQAVAQMDIGNIRRSEYLLKQAVISVTTEGSTLKQKILLFTNKHTNLLKNKDKDDK